MTTIRFTFGSWFTILFLGWSMMPSLAQTDTNAPAATPALIRTNEVIVPLDATIEDLEKMVLKPPASKAPISTMPTYIDITPPPPLSPTAQRREYGGFRLGMSWEEANLLAETGGKKLEELAPNSRYQMEGALTEVPRTDKVRTLLFFKDNKLYLIMLLWDLDHRLFLELEPILTQKYGKPLRADELFRRYWILQNDDCIRLLFTVGADQTSLLYGSKQDVFDYSEQEKKEYLRSYRGL